jgi:hypothetical protein
MSAARQESETKDRCSHVFLFYPEHPENYQCPLWLPVMAISSSRGSGCPRHGLRLRQKTGAPISSYFTQNTRRTTSVPFGFLNTSECDFSLSGVHIDVEASNLVGNQYMRFTIRDSMVAIAITAMSCWLCPVVVAVCGFR